MRVPKRWKDDYRLQRDQLYWLAIELKERLGKREPRTIKGLAREMKLWPSQIVQVATSYPRTFKLVPYGQQHRIMINRDVPNVQ